MNNRIEIEKVANGWKTKLSYYNFDSDEYIDKELVFEIKDDDTIISNKSSIETFKEMIEIMENLFEMDIVNAGDYYLNYQIKQK